MKSVLAYFSAFLLGSVPLVQAYNKDHHQVYKGNDARLNKWRTFHVAGEEEHALSVQSTPTTGNATFRQYIDHENKDVGTFEQFYFYSTEFYGGPGSPIILFTPGEVNASAYTSYLTLNRTTGVLAKEIGAAIVCIEHRYWGYSSPYADLTTENLQYLTLDNSISDLTNFAKHVRLPFDYHRKSSPNRAPWVMMGGSYSGALAAWTASTQPNTYWAYWASSAPVESIIDYWQYFVPIQQGMPKNCSSDVSLVIDHIDNILLNGTTSEITALKTKFGLEGLEHNDDFAAALQNGPWLWQGNQFYRNTGFFDFCDAVENVKPNSTNTTLPGAEGVGLDKALAGYASWFNTTYLPGSCASYGYDEWQGERNIKCFDTYDVTSPMYTDTSLSNAFDRQWVWMTCNEPFGYYQTGAPEDRPTIISRLSTPEYWIRQCPLMFPASNNTVVGLSRGATAAQVNAKNKGWNNYSPGLLYVNGDYDPWREASVSSDFRPEGKLQSTTKNPVVIVPGGFHTSDLVTQNAKANAGAKAAIDEAVGIMKGWVGEFEHGKHWFEG
ncbi:serine carboxypeptidase [Aureobasidium pullulans]|uniref:Serine carboxypeptidase n=1 Tax=Aureobasidium pullulans TaxID=5580 RepID=A0A4S8ZPL4_AURPU|nr:serine carboxypeptidase [Aureobasidium pullulans]